MVKGLRQLFFFFMLSVFISGCATTVKIASVVEKEPEGDFLLKWEVSPDREGIIDIYSSSTDSILEDLHPLLQLMFPIR